MCGNQDGSVLPSQIMVTFSASPVAAPVVYPDVGQSNRKPREFASCAVNISSVSGISCTNASEFRQRHVHEDPDYPAHEVFHNSFSCRSSAPRSMKIGGGCRSTSVRFLVMVDSSVGSCIRVTV